MDTLKSYLRQYTCMKLALFSIKPFSELVLHILKFDYYLFGYLFYEGQVNLTLPPSSPLSPPICIAYFDNIR